MERVALVLLAVPACGALMMNGGPRVTPLAFNPLGLPCHEAADPVVALSPRTLALGLAAAAAAQPELALAKGGEYGIFEGRIVSLAHPTIMATMYAASAWAAFTGLNWRRLRELGQRVTKLKAERKALEATLNALDEEHAQKSTLRAQIDELSGEVSGLSSTRSDLAGQRLREKHYQVPPRGPRRTIS